MILKKMYGYAIQTDRDKYFFDYDIEQFVLDYKCQQIMGDYQLTIEEIQNYIASLNSELRNYEAIIDYEIVEYIYDKESDITIENVLYSSEN